MKFKGGAAGDPVWINLEAVVAVQNDADSAGNLTLINTQDGEEHRVQETMDVVVNAVQS